MFIPYPIKVKPVLKEKPWGGNRLNKYFNFNKNKKIGEVWLFADQKENKSVIINGFYKNKLLSQIYKKYSKEMLGTKVANKYKNGFPILLKFIEASEDLSIQVHPDDKFAKENENSYGKTESWYILDCKKNSKILLGCKKNFNLDLIKKAIISGKKIVSMLKIYFTKKNDCYFIPAGTLHSLMSGNLILEVQQNSDITYRVYDWDRLINGKSRELHIEKALLSLKNSYLAGRVKKKVLLKNKDIKINRLIKCKYFNLSEIIIEKNTQKWYNIKNAFILIVIEGKLNIIYKNKIYKLKSGESVFLPFKIGEFLIKTPVKTKCISIEIK